MTHTADSIRQMTAPKVKELLRAHGLSLSKVARRHKRVPSLYSRVIRKEAKSERALQQIANALNKAQGQ